MIHTIDELNIGKLNGGELITYLENNVITEIDSDAAEIIGDREATALAEALKKNTTVTKLDICHNRIESAGAKALAEALKENNSLVELHLDENNIGPNGAKDLADVLLSNESLKYIGLASNNIGDKGAIEIANALKANNTLEEIFLCGNNIGNNGAKELARAVKNNKSLTTFYFANNKIDVDGAKYLAEAFANNQTLQRVDLACNKIDVDGVCALAKGIMKSKSLNYFAVPEIGMGNIGGKAFLEVLENNPSIELEFLDDINEDIMSKIYEIERFKKELHDLQINNVDSIALSGRGISDYGATLIAKALGVNTYLNTLDLSNNQIGNAGAEALARELETNRSLTSINLANNQIGDDGAEQFFLRVVKENIHLTKFILPDGISDEILKEINCYLQRNQDIANGKIDDLDRKNLEYLFKQNGFPLNFLTISNESHKEFYQSFITQKNEEILKGIEVHVGALLFELGKVESPCPYYMLVNKENEIKSSEEARSAKEFYEKNPQYQARYLFERSYESSKVRECYLDQETKESLEEIVNLSKDLILRVDQNVEKRKMIDRYEELRSNNLFNKLREVTENLEDKTRESNELQEENARLKKLLCTLGAKTEEQGSQEGLVPSASTSKTDDDKDGKCDVKDVSKDKISAPPREELSKVLKSPISLNVYSSGLKQRGAAQG